MRTRKVSVITPCYNGSGYVYRLLNSILNQSYTNIEMIVIDDGSTDNSAEIIKSYIIPFEEKGYSLTYIFQENAGQSAAINNALKLFSGEYLVWPDSDDFYSTDTAISEMVNVLEGTDESVSIVRCYSKVLDDKTLEQTSFCGGVVTTDLFEDCLFVEKNFWFGAGNYMAKSSSLKLAIPSLTIYSSKNAGQNWQILLPLLYKKKCITVQKELYSIVARTSSHSRGKYSSLAEIISKLEAYENSIINTLKSMHMPEHHKLEYIDRISYNYNELKLGTYVKFGSKREAFRLKMYIRNYYGSYNLRLCALFIVMFFPFNKLVLSFAKRLRSFF